jgi:hypothetical protein
VIQPQVIPRQNNRRALISVGVCAALVFVGLIRMLSYSLGVAGDILRDSAFGFLCYDPGSVLNVRFFKILATPTFVAAIYFLFRWRNRGLPSSSGAAGPRGFKRLDFRSPVLRGLLTSLITAQWLLIEWWKFNQEGFYPWSALESRAINIGVLIASQLIAFWGMKYLCFEPVSGEAPIDSRDRGRPRVD